MSTAEIRGTYSLKIKSFSQLISERHPLTTALSKALKIVETIKPLEPHNS